MPTSAFQIASELTGEDERTIYAPLILQFFKQNHVAFAEQIARWHPNDFKQPGQVHKHIKALSEHITYDSFKTKRGAPRHLYYFTPAGRKRYLKELSVSSEQSGGDSTDRIKKHSLHEVMITEYSVSLKELERERDDFRLFWSDRYGISQLEAFKDFIPDKAWLSRSSRVTSIDLLEVFGRRWSPKQMIGKLHGFAEWQQSKGPEFLRSKYYEFGFDESNSGCRYLLSIKNYQTGNDEAHLRKVLYGCMSLPEAAADAVCMTTTQQLATVGAGRINAPVWWWAADLRPLRKHWSSWTDEQRKNEFLAYYHKMPTHELYPL